MLPSVTSVTGKILKQLRESAGLSQEDVAMRMNVSRISVSRWENGRRDIAFLDLLRYVNSVGGSVAEVVEMIESESPLVWD